MGHQYVSPKMEMQPSGVFGNAYLEFSKILGEVV